MKAEFLKIRLKWTPAAPAVGVGSKTLVLAGIVASCMIFFSGCGGTGYPVSTVEGAILVDGKPVPEGTLSFSPMEANKGKPASADFKDGKYHAEQVPRGRNLVHINAFQETGRKMVELGIEYPEKKNLIPEKYLMGIELTVSEPVVKHDFDLKSK